MYNVCPISKINDARCSVVLGALYVMDAQKRKNISMSVESYRQMEPSLHHVVMLLPNAEIKEIIEIRIWIRYDNQRVILSNLNFSFINSLISFYMLAISNIK